MIGLWSLNSRKKLRSEFPAMCSRDDLAIADAAVCLEFWGSETCPRMESLAGHYHG